jgi:type 1 glutamine amidotransferase
MHALIRPNPRVLVFSKTTGFRHDSIPTGIAMFQELAREKDFTVEATEDGGAFTPENLKRFDCIVFLSTTGDPLNEEQQKAMEAFIENGGGYVGIHAATDTEYEWPWYGEMVGAYFKRHPAIQQARVVVEDRSHPSTAFLPNNWQRVDEWYDFRANPRGKVRVLASLDPKSYKESEMPDDHPITWCHEVGKGRSWYTEMGHTQASYHEWLYREMVYQGVLWASQGGTPAGANLMTWPTPRGWAAQGGEMVNAAGGAEELVSKDAYGDGHYHLEFKIPKGSNSGVYVQGRYELQIFDSYGKAAKDLTYADCGGLYHGPGEQDGVAPLRNALLPPGSWNSYDILFKAPKFENGKKVSRARFVEVRLNGVVILNDVELDGPTLAPMDEKEAAEGPIMLQGDHGPVSYRNCWFKPM